MSRPDERPLRRLPQLTPRRATLERCVFCPKLCRSACPVSNAEPRETITPWGKMSMAYFVANESVATAPEFAAPAWACSGCFGCREQCDHHNDVTGTLFDARSALVAAGVAPTAATETLAAFDETTNALGALKHDPAIAGLVDPEARTTVLVGCAYARSAKRAPVTHDAIRSVAALTGGKVALVDVCCGAPLLYAGDKKRFATQGEMLAQTIKHTDRLVVVDAGCAAAIRVHHADAGLAMPVPVVHFTELVAENVARLAPLEGTEGTTYRWHDPCQLGRGLGVYDAPRTILERVLGKPAAEFERNRKDARCSGGGGLLPKTMPAVASAMGAARKQANDEAGGGTIVTACASSARRFEEAGADVVDIASLVARALARG